MNFNLILGSTIPIYEQVKQQVKSQIISGKIKPHDQMPSLRQLAKDLKVGMVTVKRAYDDLVSEGYLYTIPGKGVFVAVLDTKNIKEHYENKIENLTIEIISLAKESEISKERLLKIFKSKVDEEDLK